MNDLEYLTKGKKYVAVTDWRPAQLLPSLLVCLAPFPVGPVPLGAYPMGSSSLHMLKGLDVPLYVGRPHWGRVLKMWPHQHYKGSLLGLSASAVHGSSQQIKNLHGLWGCISTLLAPSQVACDPYAKVFVRVNLLERGIVDCICHIRWCSLIGYTQYLTFGYVKMKLPSLGPSVQFRKVSLQLGTIMKWCDSPI